MAVTSETPNSGGDTPATEGRGILLSLWLALIVAANVYLAWLYLTRGASISSVTSQAPWVPPAFGALAIANVVSAIAVWRWKKWGVYLNAAAALMSFVLNVLIGISPVSAAVGLLGPVILIVLVRSHWSAMT